MKYPDPYVHIPGSRVQHLASHRDPWRRITTPGEKWIYVPRVACWHGGHSKYRDDAIRDGTPTPGLKMCKTCAHIWQWEVYSLQRRAMMMSEVLFETA